MTLMLGKGVEGGSDTVMEEVDECIMYWREMVAKMEGFVVWRANGRFWFPPPPSMNSWTQHMHYFPNCLLIDSTLECLFVIVLAVLC